MNKLMVSSLMYDAQKVLARNDRGVWTVPAGDLYPHQWLWDSCFIAIGLRHIDIRRAQTEILSLLRGQWQNGMLPHIIFADGDEYARDRDLWRSWASPLAPKNLATSGITQPPLLAEAVIKIGEKLDGPTRHNWYEKTYPALVQYHRWLYNERSPNGNGLVVNVHPYETGLDNTPPWVVTVRRFGWPWWVRLVGALHLDPFISLVRRDTSHIPPEQRMSNIEALAYWGILRRLQRREYDSRRILKRGLGRKRLAVEDLSFNCIAIRTGTCLEHIAETLGRPLPDDLAANMKLAQKSLTHLWDESTGQHYSRNHATGKLIKEPTVAALLPLYAGTISHHQAKHLVTNMLKNSHLFNLPYPVPSVPLASSYFNPVKYWQGPSWINANWLIIEGLKRYGYHKEAGRLAATSLELVAQSGMHEYFDPFNGSGAGASNFSWTAALTIDLLKN